MGTEIKFIIVTFTSHVHKRLMERNSVKSLPEYRTPFYYFDILNYLLENTAIKGLSERSNYQQIVNQISISREKEGMSSLMQITQFPTIKSEDSANS